MEVAKEEVKRLQNIIKNNSQLDKPPGYAKWKEMQADSSEQEDAPMDDSDSDTDDECIEGSNATQGESTVIHQRTEVLKWIEDFPAAYKQLCDGKLGIALIEHMMDEDDL